MTTTARAEYQERRAARASEHARLARLDARVSYARLAVVAAFAVTLWIVLRAGATPWLFAFPAAAFAALAAWHERVLRALDCASRAVTFYEHGIARIDDEWHGIGETGDRFLVPDHLYARDLDIFGPASLFQLLSRARTHLGEEVLARWLSAPADATTIRERQAAVVELREALDFREALATAGGASRDIDTAALSVWASGRAQPESIWLRATAVVLAVGIIATVAWWARGGPMAPLLVVIMLKMILTRPSRKRVAGVVRGVERPLGQLDVLADTLSLIERSTFTSARLQAIHAEIVSHGVVPSEAIRRLKRLVDLLDWRRNTFFAPVAAAVSWALHFAVAIQNWRREFGPKVIVWLDAVAEYEALSSLAAYAYEHADDPFPAFVEHGEAARFEGASLGHPLVPAARMVRNDVFLTPQTRLLIISGSNMSGKSTLLRTVGVNVVLAMAGGPVRAQTLTLSPLAVGATLHVHDSLQAGRSRFFAEISRIRDVAALAGAGPAPPRDGMGLLFLLDELFQGTNSHDRKIGAEALLLNFIDRGAIGLTTTHDLALTGIAAESRGRAVNVHFQDVLQDGELIFDYKMKPGPVTHSNALALMKAVGLPVHTIGRLEDDA